MGKIRDSNLREMVKSCNKVSQGEIKAFIDEDQAIINDNGYKVEYCKENSHYED